MAKQIPTCTSDSQTLPALMNAVLNSSALDSGAVAVGLLPRHRCCPGSCYEVESKENTHDLKELQDNKPSFQDGVESQEGGAKSPENKHSLEGLWQDNNRELFVVETVKGKPGYLFGTMIGKNYFGGPPKQPQFWFKTGDDGMPKELQGKFYLGPTQGFKASGWVEEKLYWRSDDAFEISAINAHQCPNVRYTYTRVVTDISKITLD